MKRLIVVLVAAASLSVQANVYDDVLWWFNGPVDKNGDGVLQQGEVVDVLNAGSPTHSAHSGTMTRTSYVATETVSTPAFTRTLPCLKFQDSGDNTGAFINIGSQIGAVYTTQAQSFTSHVRFKWDGVSHSAAWLLYLGSAIALGVNSTGVRFAPGENTSALPVAANTWYDIGFVMTQLAAGGCNVRVVLRKADGTTYKLNKDYADVKMPGAGAMSWRIATESGSKDTKYFTGLIQQVAFWDRGLSEAELIEAFDYQPPMPDGAGVSNGSGAEFGGAAGASVTLGSSAWKDYPARLSKGSDASFTFTADSTPCAYALRVKSASGAATLKATAGGAEATAEIAAGGVAELFLPRTAFAAGVANTISLTRTDDGGTFTPDLFALVRQAKADDEPLVYADDAEVTEPLALQADHLQRIEVAEGKTVTYAGAITGEGGIRKTGPGTLKFVANNDFSGGVTVSGGRILCDDETLTKPFGTGTVLVEQNGTGTCQAAVAGTLDNGFAFTGAASEAFPGLHFAGKTTLNGTVNVADSLWMTTAWNDTARYADTQQVTLNGKVTVFGTLALAPHCRVRFVKTIACDTLDLRWAANSATADGGNPGSVMLASCGDKTAQSGVACPMRKVKIDQTRIIQGGANIFGGRDTSPFGMAELEWTGLHRTGGSVDMNNNKMGLGRIVTPETAADDETSMTIMSTGANTHYLNFYETPTSTLYLRFVGKQIVQLASGNSTITFANRHQRSGSFIAASGSKGVVTGGTRFDVPVKFDVNSTASSWTFDGMTDPEALRKVTSINMSGYGAVSFDEVSFASLPQDYSLELTSHSGGNSTYTFPSADSVLKVRHFLDRDHERGPGTCVDTDPHNESVLCAFIKPLGAKIRVAAADAAAGGTLTWDAASQTWKDGSGLAVTDLAFNNYARATCGSGAAVATLPDSLFVQDLDLRSAGDVMMLAGDAGSRVRVTGNLNLRVGTEYFFSPKMDLAGKQTFDLGAEGKISFGGGLSLAKDDAVENVIESGTVSVGTALDGRVLVKAGATLELKGNVSCTDGREIVLETVEGEPMARLLLNGATVDKPVTFGSVGALGYFTLDAAGDKSVTNVLSGRVKDSGSTSVFCREGYTYEFRSAEFSGKHEFVNIDRFAAVEPTTVICRGDIQHGLRLGDGYLRARDNIHLVLDCAGLSSYSIGAYDGGSVVDFRRSDVLWTQYIGNPNMSSAIMLDSGNGMLLLNKTWQCCNALLGNAGSRISGEAGSAIEVCLGGDKTCSASFEGAVSLVMNGSGKQTLAGVSTSTGSLVVRQGTLEIAAGGSWANASQVLLEGGTLSVLNRNAFGRGVTELILAGGQISGRAKFGPGMVKTADGEVLPDGDYGPESGWIAEGGSVTIGTPGMMLILR